MRSIKVKITIFFLFLFLSLCEICLADAPSKTIQYEPIKFLPDNPPLYFSNTNFKDPYWEIDFSKTDIAVFNHPSLSLFGSPKKFILHLWSSSSGSELNFIFASHFQFFQKSIGPLRFGEQVIEFNAPPEGWNFHSGENDGRVRLPLRFLSLEIRKSACPSDILHLQILDFKCETEITPNQECVLIPKNEENNKDSIFSSCTFINLLPQNVCGKLTVHLTDWEQNIISSYSQDLTLPPNAQPINIKIPAHIPIEKNVIEINWIFERNDLQSFNVNTTYCRNLDYPINRKIAPDSPWGMGLYLLRYGSDQKSRELSAEIASRAGIKWTREDFVWAHIEPEPGKFQFDYYDNLVNTALNYGISVYGILCYWSNWTEPYTLKGIEDFVRYTEATVEHFKDRVKFWEIYNEPNIFFWQGPKELYPELVKRCYETIKRVDPSAQVLAISTSGIDFNFIDFCMKAGTPFDILTIHPYRRVLDEEKFIFELKRVANQVQNRPVWITEMGWSSHLWQNGVTEREQALLLARSYLSAIASGAVQNISWYDFRNDGDDPFYFESNFGIIKNNFAPKPALRACANICNLLPDNKINNCDNLGNNIIAFKQGETIVLWPTKEDTHLTARIISPPVKIQNLMGETMSEYNKKAIITLNLRKGYPIFILGGSVKFLKPKN
ncbi:MAG: beta-galactosidase [Candidatus Hydrogenedens sp.]|nr:beta-galactosidase [Candidatus Hydrogenedens sp.]